MTVVELVERERRHVRTTLAAAGWAAALAAATLILALGVVALGGARWMSLPRVLPFVVWGGAIGVCVVIARWALRRTHRAASTISVATAVEEEHSLRRGSLRGVIEVAGSGVFARRASERLATTLLASGRPALAPALRRRALKRGLAGGAVALAGVATLSGFARSAPDGWQVVRHPLRAATGTLLPALSFEHSPTSVLRGEVLTLRVRAEGRREIRLARRATGSEWSVTTLPVREGIAVVSLGAIDAAQQVVAQDGRAASDTLVITLAERPFVGDVAIRATFPAYLGRRPEPLALGEALRVPRGTILDITGSSSSTLQRIALVDAGRQSALLVSDRRFSGRLIAEQSGRWAWNAVGLQGPIADVPAPLELDVTPDSAPRIEIVSPTSDTTVAPGDRILVGILAADDYGIGAIAVRTWTVRTGRAFGEGRVQLIGAAPPQWSGSAELDLAPRGLKPGDELHVIAEAVDNSPWHQMTPSRELVLRVPGLTQRRSDARALADSAVASARATAAAQKQLQQKTSEAARSRGQRPSEKGTSSKNESSMSYEAAQQAKALARQQRELASKVQSLQNTAQELRKQLKEAGALDSALADRMAEVQKLLNEALTPELAEKLRQLEQASQSMSQDDSRQALNDLSTQQQKLREQLEKSVEMLKRAAMEGALQTLKDEAKDLAKQQRSLADSMRTRRANDEPARSQDKRDAGDLADRAKELQKEVSQLNQRLRREQADAGADQMRSAEQSAKSSADAMQRAAGKQEEKQGPQQQQQPQQAQPQAGERQKGERQKGEQQKGEQQRGEQQRGEQQRGEQQRGEQQRGEQQKGAQQQGQQGQQGQQQQQGSQAAQDAAEDMEQAAKSLADARKQQVDDWKKELSGELDQSVMEMLQLGRQQSNLEQRVRKGENPGNTRGEQSALQQGVEKASERLAKAGQKSSLLSQRSQRAVAEARQRVEQATKSTAESRGQSQTADAMRDAAESLNRAAASLVRDRDKSNSASSATGFAEMMEQMQQLAKQQGALNAQAAGMMPGAGKPQTGQAREQARQLAQQQRGLAKQLEQMGDNDATGKADDMAREARQIAQALDSQGADPNTIERQQRLFRKMLDAGRTLEQDERDESGKRESRPGTQEHPFLPPNADASGKAATRFREPTWNELRGLSAEERRLILEYFKRINSSEK